MSTLPDGTPSKVATPAELENIANLQEVQVRTDGEGEQDAVAAILNMDAGEFNDMDGREKTELLVALQKTLVTSGQESAYLKAFESRLAKHMEAVERRLAAAETFRLDPQKFIDDSIRDEGESTRSPAEKAALQAQEKQRLEGMVMNNRAKHALAKQEMMKGPKETVFWPAEMKSGIMPPNPTPISFMIGRKIRMHGVLFQYDPGQMVDVPVSVAVRVREINLSEAEKRGRRAVLGVDGKTKIQEDAKAGWDKVNQTSLSPTEDFPTY